MTCEAVLWYPQHLQLLLLSARRGAVWCQVATWLRGGLLSPFLAMNGYTYQSLKTSCLSAPLFTSHPTANQMPLGTFASSSSISSYQNFPFLTNACALDPAPPSSIVTPNSQDSAIGVNPPLPTNPQLLQSSLISGLYTAVQQQLLQQYVSLALNNGQFDSRKLNCSQLADILRTAADGARSNNNYLTGEVAKQLLPIIKAVAGSTQQVEKSTKTVESNQGLPDLTGAMQQQARGTK